MSKRSKACDISPKVKKKVWERDNHCCIICGSPYAMPNAHYIKRSQRWFRNRRECSYIVPRMSLSRRPWIKYTTI